VSLPRVSDCEAGQSNSEGHHTGLEFEDVRPIIWLDERSLILMCEVQRPLGVRLHREVEHRDVALELRVKRGAVPSLVLLRDELAAAEAELRLTGAWREYRRVVDGHTICLLLHRLPERRRGEAIAEELEVLSKRRVDAYKSRARESSYLAGTLIPFHYTAISRVEALEGRM
jgi:hypothetical protein